MTLFPRVGRRRSKPRSWTISALTVAHVARAKFALLGFVLSLRIRAEAPAAGMNSASLVSLRTFAMTPPVLSAIALLRTHFATMVLAWDGSPAWMPPGKPPLATPISILVGMKWFRSRVHQPSRPIDR